MEEETMIQFIVFRNCKVDGKDVPSDVAIQMAKVFLVERQGSQIAVFSANGSSNHYEFGSHEKCALAFNQLLTSEQWRHQSRCDRARETKEKPSG
jgi:hypothetical protein